MLDFLGIGAQKSGTTWLYEWLRHHPQIAFPGGKELHYWDGKSGRDESWYRALFDVQEPGKVRGEITPAYAILPTELVQRVHGLNPSLRLIYAIRNPIDRAWSSARMALESAVMELDEASGQWFLDHFRSRGSMQRGDYESCIRTWRATFGEDALLILRYEDIHKDPRGVLRTCCRHLRVDEGWAESLPLDSLRTPVFAGTPAAVRPSLMPALVDLYADRIRSLASYLGTNLEHWLATPAESMDEGRSP